MNLAEKAWSSVLKQASVAIAEREEDRKNYSFWFQGASFNLGQTTVRLGEMSVVLRRTEAGDTLSIEIIAFPEGSKTARSEFLMDRLKEEIPSAREAIQSVVRASVMSAESLVEEAIRDLTEEALKAGVRAETISRAFGEAIAESVMRG